jgi:hypothetical protein
MRYAVAEKLEIIRLVEQSSLSVRRTLAQLGIPRSQQLHTNPHHLPLSNPKGGNEVPGTVVHGNTTIVFESAGTHGLDSNRLLKWDQFAEGHPKIATALAYNPSLINDSGYLSKTV